MSDIVERLRSYARNCGGPPEEYLTWQAAAEIERLRATNAELLAALQQVKQWGYFLPDDTPDVVEAAIAKAEKP